MHVTCLVKVFGHSFTCFATISRPVKINNRPFSFSTKEPGSSAILIPSYTQGLMESFYHYCAHSNSTNCCKISLDPDSFQNIKNVCSKIRHLQFWSRNSFFSDVWTARTNPKKKEKVLFQKMQFDSLKNKTDTFDATDHKALLFLFTLIWFGALRGVKSTLLKGESLSL